MKEQHAGRQAFQKDLGWAEIIHPFHPLQGKRFKILKIRRESGEDTLILKGTHRGWFFIPREWTDKASPSVHTCQKAAASILSFQHLLALSKLIDDFKKA